MIEGLKPYAQYTESGLTTIGMLPNHWQLLRAKTLFREIDDRSVTGKETLLSVSHISGVRRRSETNANMFLAKSNIGYKRCQPHDLIINTMWAWMGALGVSHLSGIVSPAYAVYRPLSGTALLPGYVEHLLRAPAYVAEYTLRSSGIHSSRLRLYPEHFLRIPLAVPPTEEQAAIVRFLDHANRRIDRFIRAKKRLIALLNERKQAIIHRAVTRGLDMKLPMKDSGVPWLGEIPAHWEVSALGRAVRIISGYPFPSQGFSSSDADTRLLRGINVTPRGVNWESVVYWKRTATDDLDGFSLKVGDIVIGMDRPIIASGTRVSIVHETDTPSLLLQRVCCIRPSNRLNAGYLYLLLSGHAFYKYIEPIFTGISVPHLSPQQVRAFMFGFPPVEEQHAIVGSVQAATAKIEAAVKRVQQETALLREYRTRLIADVVTGQLDVREAVKELPVEDEDGGKPVNAGDEIEESEIDDSEQDEAA